MAANVPSVKSVWCCRMEDAFQNIASTTHKRIQHFAFNVIQDSTHLIQVYVTLRIACLLTQLTGHVKNVNHPLLTDTPWFKMQVYALRINVHPISLVIIFASHAKQATLMLNTSSKPLATLKSVSYNVDCTTNLLTRNANSNTAQISTLMASA